MVGSATHSAGGDSGRGVDDEMLGNPRLAAEGGELGGCVEPFPLVNYLPVAPVHEPECQLVNHGVLVQLDSVDTEPMDACDALTARSEGVRREHVNGVGVAQDRPLPRWTATMNASSMVSFATTCLGGSSG